MAINGRMSVLSDGVYIRELERTIRKMEERIARLEAQMARLNKKGK